MPFEPMQLTPLMSIDKTREMGGGRGMGWVYARIAAGDFEVIVEGSRRLVVTESFLKWLEKKRADSRENARSIRTNLPDLTC